MSFELVCTECGAHHDASRYRIGCDTCGGLLNVEYDAPASVDGRTVAGATGFARYLPMLPVQDVANLVTMGEGDTPLISLPGAGVAIGVKHLYGKLEMCNPTGSFKDRGNAVQVSVLKETGVTRAADIAGGNAGHSFAAYCARAGIKFVGFSYRGGYTLDGPDNRKVQAIVQTGAEMHWVEGDRQACQEAMSRFCEDTGTLNMVYGRNAYFIEGNKTMAYEIASQMDPLPDHIIVPVGNGSTFQGLWLGFKEMLEDGRVQRMPRLHGVQSEAFQPLVHAFNRGDRKASTGAADTVAIGIKIAEPPRLQALVNASRDSGGQPVAVTDTAIIAWQRRLSELEGIFVEPTSATVLAAAETLKQRGVIDEADRVLVSLTGSGFKEPIPESAGM